MTMPVDRDGMNIPPKWRDVCVHHKSGMLFHHAVKAAYELGYKYLLWNGAVMRVFDLSACFATVFKEEDLHKEE
jgi:hypothetical protein